MSIFRTYAAQRARRLAVAGVFALLSVAAVAAPDAAAPTPAPPAASAAPVTSDPVTRFLTERGLLNASVTAPGIPPLAENALVERLRDTASDMVLTAMNFIGVPYRRGGNSVERGFDCSGFTRHVFELSLGRVLPHRADEQATTAGLTSIGRDQLKPGDLVFFNTLRRTFSHVGIYIGDGKFIHAPKPGGEVRVDELAASYWSHRFTGARRADLALDAAPTVPTAAPVTQLPTAAARISY